MPSIQMLATTDLSSSYDFVSVTFIHIICNFIQNLNNDDA